MVLLWLLVILLLFIFFRHCLKYCPLIVVSVFCLSRCTSATLSNTSCRIEFFHYCDAVWAFMTGYMMGLLQILIHLHYVLTCGHSQRAGVSPFSIYHTLFMRRRHCDSCLNPRWTSVLHEMLARIIATFSWLKVGGTSIIGLLLSEHILVIRIRRFEWFFH